MENLTSHFEVEIVQRLAVKLKQVEGWRDMTGVKILKKNVDVIVSRYKNNQTKIVNVKLLTDEYMEKIQVWDQMHTLTLNDHNF